MSLYSTLGNTQITTLLLQDRRYLKSGNTTNPSSLYPYTSSPKLRNGSTSPSHHTPPPLHSRPISPSYPPHPLTILLLIHLHPPIQTRQPARNRVEARVMAQEERNATQYVPVIFTPAPVRNVLTRRSQGTTTQGRKRKA
jgi:hypothetical protein